MSDKSCSQALKDFVSETEEIIESLNLDMVRLADSVDSGDCDPDVLNGIFRGAHSIKGLSGMFGFDDLSTISHSMESLLDGLRLGAAVAFGRPGAGSEQLVLVVEGRPADAAAARSKLPTPAAIASLCIL